MADIAAPCTWRQAKVDMLGVHNNPKGYMPKPLHDKVPAVFAPMQTTLAPQTSPGLARPTTPGPGVFGQCHWTLRSAVPCTARTALPEKHRAQHVYDQGGAKSRDVVYTAGTSIHARITKHRAMTREQQRLSLLACADLLPHAAFMRHTWPALLRPHGSAATCMCSGKRCVHTSTCRPARGPRQRSWQRGRA